MNRYTLRTGIFEAFMLLVALVYVLPVLVLVNLAFKRVSDTSSPIAPVTSPTFANFTRAWREAAVGPALVNNIAVTLVSVTVLVVVASAASYPLARSTARWSGWMFYGFMVGLLLPFQLALIPLYQTMKSLHLLGSLGSLMLFHSGALLPFSIFLYTTFLRAVPEVFEEAGQLDGCGPVRLFRHIVFPLIRPATGAVIVLNGIHVWNDFLTSLLYVGGTEQQTTTVALFSFVGEYTANWPIIFAGLILTMIPVLVGYFALQRQIISGFAGGVKG